MKKRFLSLLLVLALCAALLPTVALADETVVEVSTEEALLGAIAAGEESIILMDDMSVSYTFEINQALTLDLNGHELTLRTNLSINNTLTLRDSSEDGTGVIDGKNYNIFIYGTMNANGGAVSCIVSNGGTLTKEAGEKGTVFQNIVANGGLSGTADSAVISAGIFKERAMNKGKIDGGIFYGGIDAYGNAVIRDYTITFMTDESTTYAIEVLSGNAASYEPDVPKKDGCTFGGWYEDADCNEKYTFGEPIDKNLTLYAKWSDETEESSLNFAWLFSGLAGATDLTNPTFVDVSRGAYYYNAAEWAYNKGVVGGVDSKHFAPDESCTRAQAVTMMWRAAGCPDIYGANPFVDVDVSDYYYEAVLWAVANGITSGTDETHFSPDEPCTRGQIVTFLHRAARCYQAHENYGFVDVKIGSYCEDAVNWAVSCDITNGTSEATFSPDAVCTRAQIVTFLYRNR